MTRIFYMLMAFVAGTILPVQAALNTRMGKATANPVAAAFISFAVGAVALCIYLLLSRQPFSLVVAYKQAPWYAWLGGVLGTFYVAASIVILPRLGVALTFSLVIFGQLVIALLMDHFGLLGVAVRAINIYRLAGVLLLIIGVILIRKF